MIVERLQVGIFAENCYIVGCEKTSEGVIIDPGDEPDRILSKISELELQIKYILLRVAPGYATCHFGAVCFGNGP